MAFGGQQMSQIYAASDQYQVILELLPQYQHDASALVAALSAPAAAARWCRSARSPRFSRSTMPLAINHAGQIPAITISFDLAPGKALSDAVTGVRTRPTRAIGMPASIQGNFPAPRRRSRAPPRIWAGCC